MAVGLCFSKWQPVWHVAVLFLEYRILDRAVTFGEGGEEREWEDT